MERKNLHKTYWLSWRSKIPNTQSKFFQNPSILIEKAVRGMLPKNKLGSMIFRNLRVVNGENHKFENLNPKEFKINIIMEKVHAVGRRKKSIADYFSRKENPK